MLKPWMQSQPAVAQLPGVPGAPAVQDSATLVHKLLTFSDISTDVARTGRVVLPRVQVQRCLGKLLELGGAWQALAELQNGGPLHLCCILAIDDQAGRRWMVTMKTWQNVVGGESKPTFILEGTADLLRANGLRQGSSIALVGSEGRLLLKTGLAAPPASPAPPRKPRGSPAAQEGGGAAQHPQLRGQTHSGSKRRLDGSPRTPPTSPYPSAHSKPDSPAASGQWHCPGSRTSEEEEQQQAGGRLGAAAASGSYRSLPALGRREQQQQREKGLQGVADDAHAAQALLNMMSSESLSSALPPGEALGSPGTPYDAEEHEGQTAEPASPAAAAAPHAPSAPPPGLVCPKPAAGAVHVLPNGGGLRLVHHPVLDVVRQWKRLQGAQSTMPTPTQAPTSSAQTAPHPQPAPSAVLPDALATLSSMLEGATRSGMLEGGATLSGLLERAAIAKRMRTSAGHSRSLPCSLSSLLSSAAIPGPTQAGGEYSALAATPSLSALTHAPSASAPLPPLPPQPAGGAWTTHPLGEMQRSNGALYSLAVQQQQQAAAAASGATQQQAPPPTQLLPPQHPQQRTRLQGGERIAARVHRRVELAVALHQQQQQRSLAAYQQAYHQQAAEAAAAAVARSQLGAMPSQQLGAMPSQRLAGLSSQQLGSMSSQQLGSMTSQQLQRQQQSEEQVYGWLEKVKSLALTSEQLTSQELSGALGLPTPPALHELGLQQPSGNLSISSPAALLGLPLRAASRVAQPAPAGPAS